MIVNRGEITLVLADLLTITTITNATMNL